MKKTGLETQIRNIFLFCVVILLVSFSSIYAAVPIDKVFVPNQGQWDGAARFHMRVGQTISEPHAVLDLWLTEKGYVYHLSDLSQMMPKTSEEAGQPRQSPEPINGDDISIPQHAVSVNFVGGKTPQIEAQNPVPGTFNWLKGQEASQNITGVTACKKVVYRNVYPGIDVVFDAATEAQMMETTYVLSPGANPEIIDLLISGADELGLDDSGSLMIKTSLGDITELCPVAFQMDANGKNTPVQVAFVLNGNRLGFKLGVYDALRPLYIDPAVVFSRTFGGSSTESVASMHEDSTGRYFTGMTNSTDFPTNPGAYDTTKGTNYYDWYAAKFNLANDTLLWSTFIGGDYYEYGGQSALRSDGQLVIAGTTYYPESYNFPYVYSYGSGTSYYKIAVFRLSADGSSRVSAAIFGGSYTSYQYGAGVAVNPTNGDVYITGQTYAPESYGWPWGNGGYQTTGTGNGDPFIARLNADFSQYLNSTMIPADSYQYDTGMYVALDGSGNVYVSGLTYSQSAWAGTNTIGPGGTYDMFVAKYSADLMTQYYDTRIGGSSTDPTPGYSMTSMPDYYYQTTGEGLIVDGSGRAWVTGMTASTDWPTTAGAYSTTNAGNYDVFVSALNAAGTALDYSTMIGGSSTDGGRGIGFDSAGNVYVGGFAASSNYPAVEALQTSSGGSYDFVLSVFSPNLGALLFSTYWGGTGSDFGQAVAVGPDNFVRVAGISSGSFLQVPTGSSVFGGGGGYDAGVVAFDLTQSPVNSIPTLSEWGMIVLGLLIASAAILWMKRRQSTTQA